MGDRMRRLWRKQSLDPWYHMPRPRCDAMTQREERCVMSARFTNDRVNLCKVHADMYTLDRAANPRADKTALRELQPSIIQDITEARYDARIVPVTFKAERESTA
jgi:hypothetical protein